MSGPLPERIAARIRPALERIVPRRGSSYERDKTDALAALDELLAALEAERQRAREDARKVEAYDAARATVKVEGNTRAFYVLRAEAAEAALEAERQRAKHALDRAVCSGCGADTDEGGACYTQGCEGGEMIPASELPLALDAMRRNHAEEWAEWLEDNAEIEAERDDACANCGHSRALHFRHDVYVPGKRDFQYDLCSCREYAPAAAPSREPGERRQ